MLVKSTLGFDTATSLGGTLPKNPLPAAQQPLVDNEGKVQNLPAEEDGTFWLVNARVFSEAKERQDLVMFDNEQTVRDAENRAVAQGGFVTREGKKYKF